MFMKNIYIDARKENDLTQQEASDKMETISQDRLTRIETGKITITPNDVVEMSQAYKRPDLCNYYCSHECAIGKQTITEIKPTQLSEIILKMLASLNKIEKEKNQLIDITADGEISKEELKDFVRTENELNNISYAVETLKLWIQQMLANGSIDKEEYDKIKSGI